MLLTLLTLPPANCNHVCAFVWYALLSTPVHNGPLACNATTAAPSWHLVEVLWCALFGAYCIVPSSLTSCLTNPLSWTASACCGVSRSGHQSPIDPKDHSLLAGICDYPHDKG